MANYHLYYLQDTMVVGSDNIEAANDQEAVRIAREKGDGHIVEVWNAYMRVRIIAPAKAAPASRRASASDPAGPADPGDEAALSPTSAGAA